MYFLSVSGFDRIEILVQSFGKMRFQFKSYIFVSKMRFQFKIYIFVSIFVSNIADICLVKSALISDL